MSDTTDRILKVLAAVVDWMDGGDAGRVPDAPDPHADLRARIATAIRKAAHDTGSSYPPGPHVAGVYADAVIADLGLTRESPQLCDGGTRRHRYVTDWADDDE